MLNLNKHQKEMADLSYLGSGDVETFDKLYQQYQQDPESVDSTWRKFFEGFEFALTQFQNKVIHSGKIEKEFKVIGLINAYRKRGHLFTKTNPVRMRRQYKPTLDIENYNLEIKDLDTVFQASEEMGLGPMKLKDIIDYLEETYCESIGAEFKFIRRRDQLLWLQDRIEKSKNKTKYTEEEKKNFYFHLKIAVGFEKFIHKKFVGQKRFSLEGAEAMIPALNNIIESGAELGVKEFVVGMAHRGRLNILGNIMQKPYENIFREFKAEKFEEDIVLGDVKYHLGYVNEFKTSKGKQVKVSLAPNPSHLETVLPVIEGISRSKIDLKYKSDFQSVLPIAIHGDAAIAAQGVVYEVAQMVALEGYKTGGTIHMVINNQLGFTTNYTEARSSTYCTDVGKVTKSPIFHVNGDDIEALVHVTSMAIEYRQEFHSDVFIDVLAYRKYGHNEGDEPRFTQPTLYKKIAKHPSPRDVYSKKLIEEGIYTPEIVKELESEFDALLEDKFEKSQTSSEIKIQKFLEDEWKGFRYAKKDDFETDFKSGVSAKDLKAIAKKIHTLPKDHKFINKIAKLVNDRLSMLDSDKLDWAMAELLAYATLVKDGYPVRVSGQDSLRGTFSHRHAGWVMEDTDEKYIPLHHVDKDQAKFDVYNSLLSEYGVLGFEYGYALASPKGLNIWEAQFGDFNNVAQVIFDQYISSAEEKWGVMNGVVLLLPHGYEGQGPEHSSARIERFLSACSRQNMQVTNCTTPANFFHLLRQQVLRPFRVPLVVFTPKSLLRHPSCISTLKDLTDGTFQPVIDDSEAVASKVDRIVFCSGKIYYDLKEKKDLDKIQNTAVVRIEQVHPFPEKTVEKILKKYKHAKHIVWAQEEPENMGAWTYIRDYFDQSIICIARSRSATPATGLSKIHLLQQQAIVEKAFTAQRTEKEKKVAFTVH